MQPVPTPSRFNRLWLVPAAALLLAALAYFVPTVAGGTPVVYAACTTIAVTAGLMP